ncbi:melanocortin-2 receptor accessory protein 2A isoform X1 [Danio rerio]|uniref:Melanocortin-2 receptor accessory protein 2A isoform X1 n=1 Tax=Danio rerio TaxID=7955 RepID=A0AC58HER5_DANRE
MPRFQLSNSTSVPNHNYEWSYEYYDDEEPVSFEGLKAHRYSIVIGFWVGLAVFVIFMFFVLTLLTKTGAPHPEGSLTCMKILADWVTDRGGTKSLFGKSQGSRALREADAPDQLC